MFHVPDSDLSSTTSTPIFKGAAGRRYYDDEQQTPELASTTPLVPPPSQPFASSALRNTGTGVSKLQFSQNAWNPSNPPRPLMNFGLSTNTQDTYGDDSQADYTTDLMDEEYTQYTHGASTRVNQFAPVRSLMTFSTMDQPNSLLRSSKRSSNRFAHYSALSNTGNKDFIPSLIRDMRQRLPAADVENDPDSVVVSTEQVLQSITEDAAMADDATLEIVLADAAKDLEEVWEGSQSGRRKRKDEDLLIGPGPGAPPFEKARFLAILLLRLYNYSKVSNDDVGVMSMPQIMLDWLNNYHQTIESVYTEVMDNSDNVTASDLFWDLVECLIARGKFDAVRTVLQSADFSYAVKEDARGWVPAHYTGIQLQTVADAVTTLRQVLEASPIVQSNDFQTNGPEWTAYRRDVENALEMLRESADDHDDSLLREAEEEARTNLLGKDLPYDIFQRLQTIYMILLGSTSDLIAVSNDWLEASFFLTIWWNGTPDNKVQQWSFDVSRAHNPTQTNALTTKSYLDRLRDSFLCVTDPTAKHTSQMDQLNHQSDVELTIGAILQGDIASALSLVQTQSLCVTATLAELGTWSGWFSSQVVPEGLNEEDLMVLTHGAKSTPLSKDQILEHYAHALFECGTVSAGDGTPIEGWELAISVMSRCNSKELASRTVQGFLAELQVTDMERAQRLIQLCTDLGMKAEAQKVSEQFGDHLVNTSNEYGTALLCYARSGAEQKVRQLIDLLNSYCLVQSKAYPDEEKMDQSLKRLVSDPKQALAGIADQDPDALEVLQFYLVGYACLRRLYVTRDGASDASITSRKKMAAKALIAAINSAADSIYGGLYDPARQSAIQVDGLLPLLGEATALAADQNDGTRVFSSEQLYAILAAVEDLQTVSDRVYAATEECLGASLRQYSGSNPPSPHDMLKKSMSSGTNSNFSFSMMGSEMLAQSSESIGGKSFGSAVMVGGSRRSNNQNEDLQRTWDWRSQFKGQDVDGAQVLQILRRSVAQELSIANLEEGL